MSTEPRPLFRRDYQMTYYTGVQMQLYIGDVWIDEVTYLAYSVSQDKQPIYGYASQIFDTSSRGPVIVQGEFSINFKDYAYLYAVLKRWANIGGEAFQDTRDEPSIEGAAVPSYLANKRSSPYVTTANEHYTANNTIEHFVEGRATTEDRKRLYHEITGNSRGGKAWDALSSQFEAAVWGSDSVNAASEYRRTDDNVYDGFDMYIVFGNHNIPYINTTAQKIVGVRLNSQAKAIKIDGEPTQERYSFIAQTII
jgi:hypothetical protein